MGMNLASGLEKNFVYAGVLGLNVWTPAGS